MYYINIFKKIVFFCLILPFCFAQELTKNIHYQTEIGTYLSTSGQTPFWLRSNQYGIVPLSSQFITLRGSAHKDYDSITNTENKLKRFSYGYGLNAVVNVGKINQLLLPEAYLKVRFGAFEFYGGRRKEIVGLVDTLLTSGSYIWSGNALPIPKIQISIPNYTSIIGHGLISIKGGYAHGWFGNQIMVKDYYLHQKWLYSRIGKPNWKIKFYAGFNHQVQWGGRPIKPFIETQTGNLISKFPTGLETYLKVISGISLNTIINTPDIPTNEAWNRAGNHLGSIDLGTEISFKKVNLLMYRQSIYDDGSLFYLNNISDGLFGIALSRNKTKNGTFKILFEYLSTKNQGGSAGGGEQSISELRGRDDYFNNSLYSDGWAYNTNVIGTPAMIPLKQIKSGLISSNDIKNVPETFIANNRFQLFHLGMAGTILDTSFYLKWANSKNFGYFATPFTNIACQNSFLLSFSKSSINHITYKMALTGDIGQLFNNNLGFQINVLKSW